MATEAWLATLVIILISVWEKSWGNSGVMECAYGILVEGSFIYTAGTTKGDAYLLKCDLNGENSVIEYPIIALLPFAMASVLLIYSFYRRKKDG